MMDNTRPFISLAVVSFLRPNVVVFIHDIHVYSISVMGMTTHSLELRQKFTIAVI